MQPGSPAEPGLTFRARNGQPFSLSGLAKLEKRGAPANSKAGKSIRLWQPVWIPCEAIRAGQNGPILHGSRAKSAEQLAYELRPVRPKTETWTPGEAIR